MPQTREMKGVGDTAQGGTSEHTAAMSGGVGGAVQQGIMGYFGRGWRGGGIH
jgi:hypothetical protein